jgi:aspartate kinase
MKVFKFGGASIKDANGFKNSANIISSFSDQKLVVIVSAMGKTTNALEKVVQAFTGGDNTTAIELFKELEHEHLVLCSSLLPSRKDAALHKMKEIFTEIEWLLHDQPVRHFDYYYDQIVCSGELLSTIILNELLIENGCAATWLDVRDVLRTDDQFRNAGVDWNFCNQSIPVAVDKAHQNHQVLITQGFIGSTYENESTTLGREGSDYTAAIFANVMNAESVTIWKDVDAVMNADPKLFSDAVNIPVLSFLEVIEMAYYGAQVIHPKTIKPLQNKGIPLLVKSFLDPLKPGTRIDQTPVKELPPIVVKKQAQVLVKFTSKDFSFLEDQVIDWLQEKFSSNKLNPNVSQKTAISLLCCFDDKPEKLEALSLGAAEVFDVEMEKDLILLTVRHYQPAMMEQLIEGNTILLEQKTPDTIQVLMRKRS